MLDKDKCDWELTSSFWNFECRISCKMSQGDKCFPTVKIEKGALSFKY